MSGPVTLPCVRMLRWWRPAHDPRLITGTEVCVEVPKKHF